VTLDVPTTRPAGLPTGTGRLETVSLGPFALTAGTALPELVTAYRHDGPAPGKALQVVVVHALTGSADAADDWWAPLIGPGLALDTDRVGVLCVNLLGGRYGTTGPTSIDPRTNRAYGNRFPAISTRDQAAAQWRLLDALGIDEVSLVVGGSLGGMVALEIAVQRPSAVRRVMPIAAPAATGPLAVAWNHLQVQLVERLGAEGLSLARQLAMTTYRSEADFDERFGRSREADGRLSIVSYLEYQGRKLVDRFDPATYRVLAGAMLAVFLIGNGLLLEKFYSSGRGDYLSAVRFIAANAGPEPARVAGYHQFHVSTALAHAVRKLGLGETVRFVTRDEDKRFPAEWYIDRGAYAPPPPPVIARPSSGGGLAAFKRMAVFPSWGLSGDTWVIYRRTSNRRNPGAVLPGNGASRTQSGKSPRTSR